MNCDNTPKIALIVIITLLFCTTTSIASTSSYLGTWSDNTSGTNRIGDLTIENDAIRIKNLARYFTTPVGSFGTGELFKVSSVDPNLDGLGCGPDEQVRYIIIKPILNIPGFPQQAIQVIFYGGTEAPKPSTIDDDMGVCTIHPFGRKSP